MSVTTPIPGFNKTSDQLVLDQINIDNSDVDSNVSINLTFADVTFGNPTVYTDNNESNNTQLTVTSNGNTTLPSSTVVYYNRLDFGIFFGGLNIQIPLPQGATSTVDLLPSINSQFGMQLTSADIQNVALNSTAVLPVTQTLTANVNSYAFTGQFNIQIT